MLNAKPLTLNPRPHTETLKSKRYKSSEPLNPKPWVQDPDPAILNYSLNPKLSTSLSTINP